MKIKWIGMNLENMLETFKIKMKYIFLIYFNFI